MSTLFSFRAQAELRRCASASSSADLAEKRQDKSLNPGWSANRRESVNSYMGIIPGLPKNLKRVAALTLLIVASVISWVSLKSLSTAPLIRKSDLTTLGKQTSFESVYTGPKWDIVCYLDPYSFPSKRIPSYLPEVGSSLTYQPSDLWIDEEQVGLVFIDTALRTAHVMRIRQADVYRIVGPRCLESTKAHFIVERVPAPNLTYTRLTFINSSRAR